MLRASPPTCVSAPLVLSLALSASSADLLSQLFLEQRSAYSACVSWFVSAIEPYSSFRAIVPQWLLHDVTVLEDEVIGVVQEEEIRVVMGASEM